MHGELAFRRIGTARAAAEQLARATDVPILELPEWSEGTGAELQDALVREFAAWMSPS